MDKFCVILRVTRTTIEIRYKINNDRVEFLTLDKNGPEIPLAFYLNGDELIVGRYAEERAQMNDSNAYVNYFELIKDRSRVFQFAGEQRPVEQLLYLGVESYLAVFLKEKLLSSEWSIESKRQSFPLMISFAGDVSNNERRFVLGLFAKAGYGNVREVFVENYLFSIVAPLKDNKILLSGLGGDLYINYYPSMDGPSQKNKKIEGLGNDSRYHVCAAVIYDELKKSNPWIMAQKQNNMGLLLQEAEKVLSCSTPLYLGHLELDTGESGDFQINKKDLENKMTNSHNTSTVINELDHFIEVNSIKPADVDIILEGGVNTDYFASRLRASFPSVYNVSYSNYDSLWEMVFKTVYNSNKPEDNGATPNKNNHGVPSAPLPPPPHSGQPSTPPTPRKKQSTLPPPPPPGRPSQPPTPKKANAPTPPPPMPTKTKKPIVPPPPPSGGKTSKTNNK